MTTRLVLWDIDHTLIETGGVGSEVFRSAFEQVTGRKIDEMADVTGRTEQVIFADTLKHYDIEDPGDYFPKFVAIQAQEYQARSKEMRQRGRVLPGAREALDALAAQPGIIQTVLTGNPRASAEIKLHIFRLGDQLDFDSGAYGEDATVRAHLVSIARRRAMARHQVILTTKMTVIIGDTTSDVEAGHEGGARVIAVATGIHAADTLRGHGAATVLPNLADTVATVHAVLNV